MGQVKGSNLILFNLRKKLNKEFADLIAANIKKEPQIYSIPQDCFNLCLWYCWGKVETLINIYPERREIYNFPAIMKIFDEAFKLACSELA